MPGAGKIINKDHSVAGLNLLSTGKGGLLGLAGNSILFCLSCHFFHPLPTHTQKPCKDLVSYTVSELWGGPPGSWSYVKVTFVLRSWSLQCVALWAWGYSICGGPGPPAAVP